MTVTTSVVKHVRSEFGAFDTSPMMLPFIDGQAVFKLRYCNVNSRSPECGGALRAIILAGRLMGARPMDHERPTPVVRSALTPLGSEVST